MRAVRLTAWQTEPELREVETPVPGPGEVLVEVEATGLCHSDLHVMDWPAGTLGWTLPVTLGHEVAGRVAALGEGAAGVRIGDPVLVYGPWGCGTCPRCASGAENLCEQARDLARAGCGLGYDGGLAEYLLVPSARLLVPRGELDAAEAAPLTDAALTPYHALKPQLWRLRPGSAVVVIGVGGLGHVAVQLVRELSPARIVAIDPRAASRRLALDAGAHAALDSAGLTAADVRAETGDAGAALVLDFVGSDETLQLAGSVLEMGGRVSIVGVGAGALPIAHGTMPPEWSAGRPRWGTLPELHEVVALAQAGRLEVEVERVALEDTIVAYRRLRRGEIAGRAVAIP